jgi:cell division inhibitor SulA
VDRRESAPLAGYVDDAAVRNLRASWGGNQPVVLAWARELDRATHRVLTSAAGQPLTEQAAHSFVEAVSVMVR